LRTLFPVPNREEETAITTTMPKQIKCINTIKIN
jgi:hypothetical protein